MDYFALSLPGGQTINPPSSIPSGGTDILSKVIGNSINIFIIIAIVLTVASIIWSGVQWTSSSGDKGKIASARARLTWSVIGLIIVLLAYLIINIVGGIFGVSLTK